MKSSWCAAALFAALLAVCPAAGAAKLHPELSAGLGFMAGDAAFEIGRIVDSATGREVIPFPISRLEYPLDMVMGTVRGDLAVGDRWSFHLEGRKNIYERDLPAKDSDWVYFQGVQITPPLIYSETEVEIDAWQAEGGGRFVFYRGYQKGWDSLYGRKPNIRWSFGAGLGYRYLDISYDESNLNQWYPLIPQLPADRVPGAVAVYELREDIPYGELFMKVDHKERFSLEMSIGGSPFVHVEDKGNWLLRGLVFTMDSGWNGEAVLGEARARYRITNHWFSTLSAEFFQVTSKSVSNSFSPATGHYSIDAETSTNGWFVGLTAGYRFGATP